MLYLLNMQYAVNKKLLKLMFSKAGQMTCIRLRIRCPFTLFYILLKKDVYSTIINTNGAVKM